MEEEDRNFVVHISECSHNLPANHDVRCGSGRSVCFS